MDVARKMSAAASAASHESTKGVKRAANVSQSKMMFLGDKRAEINGVNGNLVSR